MFVALALSMTLTLIAIALLLIILDVFFVSDILSLVAYAVAAGAIALNLPTGFIGDAIAGALLWFGFAVLHYSIYRKYIFRILHHRVAPLRHRDAAKSVVGRVGAFRLIDSVAMIEIDGDLWPAHRDSRYDDGTEVRVVRVNDGALVVVVL